MRIYCSIAGGSAQQVGTCQGLLAQQGMLFLFTF